MYIPTILIRHRILGRGRKEPPTIEEVRVFLDKIADKLVEELPHIGGEYQKIQIEEDKLSYNMKE